MKFGTRLALFLALTLGGVQALTVVVGYGVTRTQLADKGQAELNRSAELFKTMLKRNFMRAEDALKVLSLDYALRAAISHKDLPTASSALANHGRRAGVQRMMLIGLDGVTQLDTQSSSLQGRRFPFPGLLDRAQIDGRAAGLANLRGQLFWVIAATVDAPDPVAFVVGCAPVDGEVVETLRQASALDTSIFLFSTGETGKLSGLAAAGDALRAPGGPSEALAGTPSALTQSLDRDGYLAAEATIDTIDGSAPVTAIFGFSLQAALRPYDAVLYPLLAVFLLGLSAAIIGAALIARRVSRPLEQLAEAAQRVHDGQYDIPSIQSAEGEVRKLSLSLSTMARAVRNREAELQAVICETSQARDAAQRADMAKTDFLANMSHEIRTPLNAVLGLAGVLLDEPMAQGQLHKVKLIRDAGEGLLEVLNDILDLSKLEAGKFESELCDFGLESLSQGCFELFQQRATAKGLRLRLTIADGGDTRVRGDAAHIRQVLLNLVGNAIKFTAAGEVEIIVAATQSADAVNAKWTVCDTGIGISGDKLARLFQPFEQADTSISRKYGGTGLGLAICKRLAGHLGGAIDVVSQPGAGSTFTFSAPLAPAPEAARDAEPTSSGLDLAEAAAGLGRKLRVLLVEDNVTNQYVARCILEADNVDVQIANNGVEAVAAAAERAFDVIFMDVQMPEMDGLTATRVIRASNGLGAATPIVGFSANAYAQDIQECMNAGMTGFVAKPVRKEALRHAAASAILGKRAAAPALSAPQDDITVPVAFARGKFDELVEDLGQATAAKLLRSFAADARIKIAALPGLLGNSPALKIEVHALKSAGAQLGASALSALAKSLEARCVAGDPVEARDLADLETALADFEQSAAICGVDLAA